MTNERPPPPKERRTRFQGEAGLDLVALEPGQRVRLAAGGTAEVVDNPRDGMWILLRYLAVPDEPALEGTEDLVFWADVAGVED